MSDIRRPYTRGSLCAARELKPALVQRYKIQPGIHEARHTEQRSPISYFTLDSGVTDAVADLPPVPRIFGPLSRPLEQPLFFFFRAGAQCANHSSRAISYLVCGRVRLSLGSHSEAQNGPRDSTARSYLQPLPLVSFWGAGYAILTSSKPYVPSSIFKPALSCQNSNRWTE